MVTTLEDKCHCQRKPILILQSVCFKSSRTHGDNICSDSPEERCDIFFFTSLKVRDSIRVTVVGSSAWCSGSYKGDLSKRQSMRDKNKRKGIEGEGPLHIQIFWKANVFLLSFQATVLFLPQTHLFFLRSHFIFFENTYMLKMFSLWINFFLFDRN